MGLTLGIMIRRLLTTLVETQPLPNITQEFAPGPKAAMFRSREFDSLNWLHTAAPCFPVNAKKITILHKPKDFYDTLISKISTAKRRITLASLYLGTGELEHKLVEALKKSLQDSNGKLQVDVLLDFTRGTRGEHVNSKTMLLPLLKEFTDNFRLSLYHTPALRGITKKLAPPRWNELMGLQHIKLYLMDDTVIISGANLSHDYFHNRQDRYIVIENASALADFYSGFVNQIQQFSFQVKENDTLTLRKGWEQLPYKGAANSFINDASQIIVKYMNNAMLVNRCNKNDDEDTWVFPLTEMGQLWIHHDSTVTKTLLSSAPPDSQMKLATGYFNLTKDYMDTLTYECKAKCTLLMAHPNANGFQGARGPAGGIPAAYSLLARYFYSKLQETGQDDRVTLMEYERPGWSYHAKGLWYYLPNMKLPSLTLIGSSNFGERSVNRDLETQLCLVTSNENLQNRLEEEWHNLQTSATTASDILHDRPIPKWVHAAVWLFRNYF